MPILAVSVQFRKSQLGIGCLKTRDVDWYRGSCLWLRDTETELPLARTKKPRSDERGFLGITFFRFTSLLNSHEEAVLWQVVDSSGGGASFESSFEALGR